MKAEVTPLRSNFCVQGRCNLHLACHLRNSLGKREHVGDQCVRVLRLEGGRLGGTLEVFHLWSALDVG